MRLFTHSVLLVLAALPVHAQNPRPSVQVNTNLNSNGGQVGVASSGDLSAICWSDTTTDEVFVVTSDGRGLTWNPQVRVDNDGTNKKTQTDSVFVVGNSVYVVWESGPPGSGAFFARSTDAGVSYSTPTPLDIGPGTLNDYRVAVSPGAGGDHVYVLFSTMVADDDVYLTASHDGGASFSAAVEVPSVGSTGGVDEIAVGANGNTVHVVWDDNRSGSDTVYYQRSTDGGATFLPNDVELGDNVGVEDSGAPLEIAVDGARVAVMWHEEPAGIGLLQVVQANVSTNAGTSFAGATTVGNYAVGTDDTDFGTVAIDPGTGNVIVAWEDNRTGMDQAYAAVSTNGGASFLADAALSPALAEKPRVVAGTNGVVVAWEGQSFPRRVESSLSSDGGLTWSAAFPVSDNAPDTVDFVTVAYGDRYNNFVHAWSSLNASDFNIYGGGFRPQTVTPVGFVAGPTTARFDLSLFSGSQSFSGVLATLTPGGAFALPFGDGRATGLTIDSLFLVSLNQVTTTFFAPLGPDGSGSTVSFPASFTPPFSASFVAISYQLGGGVTFGELTDLTPVSIP